MINRRDFLKKAIQTGAALALSPLIPQAVKPDALNILKTKDFIDFLPYQSGAKASQILMYANICISNRRPQYVWKLKARN